MKRADVGRVGDGIGAFGTALDAFDTMVNGGAKKQYENEKTCTQMVQRGAVDGAVAGLGTSVPGAGLGILVGMPVSLIICEESVLKMIHFLLLTSLDLWEWHWVFLLERLLVRQLDLQQAQQVERLLEQLKANVSEMK